MSSSTVSIERISLKMAKDYHYLNQSGCMEIENVDDAAQFREVVVSFRKWMSSWCPKDQIPSLEVMHAIGVTPVTGILTFASDLKI